MCYISESLHKEVCVCVCMCVYLTLTSIPLGIFSLLFCVIRRSHLELTWTVYQFTLAADAKGLLRQNKMHGAVTKCQYLMSYRREKI